MLGAMLLHKREWQAGDSYMRTAHLHLVTKPLIFAALTDPAVGLDVGNACPVHVIQSQKTGQLDTATKDR